MKSAANSELLFKLPSVDTLLRAPSLAALLASDGLAATTDAVRIALSRLREEVGDGRMDEKSLDLALGGLAAAVERQLRQSLSYSLLRLINATGVILHTNLGRAPLGAAALDHVRDAASAYSNLEFDLATGERGKRDVHCLLYTSFFSQLWINFQASSRFLASLRFGLTLNPATSSASIAFD